jgi:hypothetical protein
LKRLTLYTVVCLVVIVISLFLPIEVHDHFADHFGYKLQRDGRNLRTGIIKYGYQYIIVFLPIGLMILNTGLTLIKQEKTLAIVSVVFGFIAICTFWLIWFKISWHISLFAGPINYRLHIGFYLMLVMACFYEFILVVNMIVLHRISKQINNALH